MTKYRNFNQIQYLFGYVASLKDKCLPGRFPTHGDKYSECKHVHYDPDRSGDHPLLKFHRPKLSC